MAVFDLFSKRQKRARGEVPDVYVYDQLPQQLRVQIVHIIEDTFGNDKFAEARYILIKQTLCKEYGLFELIKHPKSDGHSVINFFLLEESTERALDVVELCFKFINVQNRDNNSYQYSTVRKQKPDDAISELNERFKEHGVGYQFESDEIIRVDSEFIHAEVVKPALMVLRGEFFKGANEEFLMAHKHYRHGRHKECLVYCLKAFESTMKAICKIRGWPTQPGNTASNLITICLKNGLLPTYLESQFNSLRSLLETGIPPIRNKSAAHGQGVDIVEVPEYLARYALNLTATNILFLAEANESTK